MATEIKQFSQRYSGVSAIGKLIRFPLRFIPRGVIVHVREGSNKGFKWSVGAGTHACWLGFYERDKQSAIKRFSFPGMIAFDIGANVGFYTLALSRLAGRGGGGH